jgi:hypothetical protein
MPNQNAGQPEQDSRTAKLEWYGRVLTTVVVLLAIAGLVAVYLVSAWRPETDDAEIFANYIGIAPVVEGPILHLNVADNQHVKQGDLLFEIDDRPYKYALDRAESDRGALDGQIVDEHAAHSGRSARRHRLRGGDPQRHRQRRPGARPRSVRRKPMSPTPRRRWIGPRPSRHTPKTTCTASSLCSPSSTLPSTRWTRRVRQSGPARSPCMKPSRNWLSIEAHLNTMLAAMAQAHGLGRAEYGAASAIAVQRAYPRSPRGPTAGTQPPPSPTPNTTTTSAASTLRSTRA